MQPFMHRPRGVPPSLSPPGPPGRALNILSIPGLPSCILFRSVMPAGRPPLDLSGKQFGRLTALAPAIKNGRRAWQCKCSCGNGRVVQTANLTRNRTRSCGCLQRSTVSERNAREWALKK